MVEGATRSINVSFIEVHGFSRRQSCILCIVCIEGCVGPCILCTVCTLPSVKMHTLIFEPSVYFLFLLMDFGAVGVLIVVGFDVFFQPLCAMLQTIFQ